MEVQLCGGPHAVTLYLTQFSLFNMNFMSTRSINALYLFPKKDSFSFNKKKKKDSFPKYLKLNDSFPKNLVKKIPQKKESILKTWKMCPSKHPFCWSHLTTCTLFRVNSSIATYPISNPTLHRFGIIIIF